MQSYFGGGNQSGNVFVNKSLLPCKALYKQNILSVIAGAVPTVWLILRYRNSKSVMLYNYCEQSENDLIPLDRTDSAYWCVSDWAGQHTASGGDDF